MLTLDMELRGLDEVLAAMNALGSRVHPSATRASVEAASRVIKDGAVSRVKFRTGDAERAIEVELEQITDKDIRFAVGVIREKWYWRFLELGAEQLRHNWEFLRPTIKEDADKARRAARDAFWETLTGRRI